MGNGMEEEVGKREDEGGRGEGWAGGEYEWERGRRKSGV